MVYLLNINVEKKIEFRKYIIIYKYNITKIKIVHNETILMN